MLEIAESPDVSKVYCAPGNGGTKEVAENVDISPDNIDSLLDFVVREKNRSDSSWSRRTFSYGNSR